MRSARAIARELSYQTSNILCQTTKKNSSQSSRPCPPRSGWQKSRKTLRAPILRRNSSGEPTRDSRYSRSTARRICKALTQRPSPENFLTNAAPKPATPGLYVRASAPKTSRRPTPRHLTSSTRVSTHSVSAAAAVSLKGPIWRHCSMAFWLIASNSTSAPSPSWHVHRPRHWLTISLRKAMT